MVEHWRTLLGRGLDNQRRNPELLCYYFPLHSQYYNFKFSQKKQKNMKKDIDKNLTPQITKRVETTENLQTKLTLQD